MDPRRQEASDSTLVRWMGLTDANSAGNVHGGTVMRLCDEAAGLCAIKHSGRRVVTAGMDRMNFLHPVAVGELLRCQARVNAVWGTSMEVGVRVESENPYTAEVRHTSTAYLTMVALDEDGRPTQVRHLEGLDAEGTRREREAGVRREHRLAERKQILEGRG